MKILIIIGIIMAVVLLLLIIWSLCIISGTQDTDEEQIRYIMEMKNKDDDMPM